MKKNSKFSTILCMVVGLSFYSCEDDSSLTNEQLLVEPTPVNIILNKVSPEEFVFETGGQVTFEVTLSAAIDYDVDVRLTAKSDDNSIETTPGVKEVTFPTIVTIASGSMAASITTTFSDDTIRDISEVYTFSIENVTSTSGTYSNNFNLTNIQNSSSVTSILVYDTPTIVTSVGDVNAILDWTGSSFSPDLDLYLMSQPSASSSAFDFSFYSKPEVVTIRESFSDGDYFIGLDNWNIATPYDVPCDFSITFPDGQTLPLLTSLTITETAGANSAPDIWFKVTKFTFTNEVWYYIQ